MSAVLVKASSPVFYKNKPAESLLIARYHHNLQVPYHRTRSGFDFALRRFLKSLDPDQYAGPIFKTDERGQIKNMDFERFADLDDCSIIEAAKQKRREGDKWAGYLLRAEHLRPVIDTSSNSESGTAHFKKVCQKLKNIATLKEGEDFFIQEEFVEVLKNASHKGSEKPVADLSPASCQPTVEAPPYGQIYLLGRGGGGNPKPLDICERSWIFRQLVQEPPKIYRLYACPGEEETIRSIINQD